MSSSPNYLTRYPYTLNKWYAEAPPAVNRVYKTTSKHEIYEKNLKKNLQQRSATFEDIKDGLRRPLLTAKLNSAYRLLSPGEISGAKPYNLPYNRSYKSRFLSEGPTRYKIDHQF